MKIGILFPMVARKPTGGHKVLYEYCNELVDKGYDISLYYLYGDSFARFGLPELLRKIAVKVYGEVLGPKKWFKLDKRIKKRVIGSAEKMCTEDVVIATAVETAYEVNKISGSACKKIYFIQDFENWNVSDEDVYKTYSMGMRNVVVSSWLKEIVELHSNSSCELVPNGINTNIFFDSNIRREPHSIVFHYRDSKHKGGNVALSVINRLHELYPDLQVSVIMSVKSVVKFPRCCTCYYCITPEKIAMINNKSQVFICTSVKEGFGLPGLEAMACGCAVASTSYLGVLEYAVNEKNSLLSDVNDVDGMVNNIVRLFEDDSLRNRLVENGLKTGLDRSINKTSQMFENLLLP